MIPLHTAKFFSTKCGVDILLNILAEYTVPNEEDGCSMDTDDPSILLILHQCLSALDSITPLKGINMYTHTLIQLHVRIQVDRFISSFINRSQRSFEDS